MNRSQHKGGAAYPPIGQGRAIQVDACRAAGRSDHAGALWVFDDFAEPLVLYPLRNPQIAFNVPGSSGSESASFVMAASDPASPHVARRYSALIHSVAITSGARASVAA